MSSNIFEVNCLLILFLAIPIVVSKMKMSENYLKYPMGQQILVLVLSSISASVVEGKSSAMTKPNMAIVVCYSCHNTVPHTGWFKQ